MWLIDQQVKHKIESAEAKSFAPTASQLERFEARDGGSFNVAGTVAHVNVTGVLTAAPDIFAFIFGGGNTTYSDIERALAAADADPKVEEISMFIDSPGGQVHGLFECLAAIQTTNKPIRVKASQATSAAYAIAATAGSITATSPGSFFGSVGVVVEGYVSEGTVTVTSTEAPNKRPDLKTEEGKAVMREHLDAIHELFVDAIATGRGKSVDTVNADFGRGGVVLANDALKRGMIDSITTKQAAATTAGGVSQEKTMDLQTLKAQHPALYAQAVQEGVDQEYDRVSAFLVAGTSSGDMKTAVEAIEGKSQMTQKLQMQFLMAARNGADTNARKADDEAAAKALENAAGSEEDDGDRDQKAGKDIMAKAFEFCGVEA